MFLGQQSKKNMSKDIKKILKKEEYIYRSCNDFLVLKWKDKRCIYDINETRKYRDD